MNRGIATALVSMGAAQLLKVPFGYTKNKEWDFTKALEPGGMPSSHSAGVVGLTTYTAMKKGFASIEFAISAIYGLVVLYDAMGVRRHAGEMAIEVNELDRKVEELADQHPGVYHEKREEALKEKIGHMPVEVLAGSALGAAIGAASYYSEWRRAKSKLRFLLGR